MANYVEMGIMGTKRDSMFSFRRKKLPNARFAQVVFLLLVVLFAFVGLNRPVMGLVGLGTTLIIATTLVEVNRKLIWEGYKKAYKKSKGWNRRLNEPLEVYYAVNVYMLWPMIFLLGVAALVAAYYLS